MSLNVMQDSAGHQSVQMAFTGAQLPTHSHACSSASRQAVRSAAQGAMGVQGALTAFRGQAAPFTSAHARQGTPWLSPACAHSSQQQTLPPHGNIIMINCNGALKLGAFANVICGCTRLTKAVLIIGSLQQEGGRRG